MLGQLVHVVGSTTCAVLIPVLKIGIGGVAIVPKVLRKIWKEAAKDINAAGASIILHSCMFTGCTILFIASAHVRQRTKFMKSVSLVGEITWNPDGNIDDNKKRAFLKWIMGEQLPQWISFPDWERTPFLQAIISSLWPGINVELSNIVRRELEKINLNVTNVDFGKIPVTIYGIKIIPSKSRNDASVVEGLVAIIDVRWAGEPIINLNLVNNRAFKVLGAVGLRSVEFSGQFRVTMEGIRNQAPFLSNLSISLMDCPKPSLKFSIHVLDTFLSANLMGAVQVAIPQLHRAIQDAILGFITWPEKIDIPFNSSNNDSAEKERLAPPLGILEVEVVSADLAPRRGLFGREKKLNPRVSLVLAPAASPDTKKESESFTLAATQGVFSHAVESSNTPEWKNQRFKFVVTSRSQVLRLFLTHKRRMKNENLKEPMGFEKPLGSQEIPLDELLPVPPPILPMPSTPSSVSDLDSAHDSTTLTTTIASTQLDGMEYFTPPCSPRTCDAAVQTEISFAQDTPLVSTSSLMSTWGRSALFTSLSEKDLEGSNGIWVDIKTTDKTSLAALLSELLPSKDMAAGSDVDVFYDAESGEREALLQSAWQTAAMLQDLMDEQAEKWVDLDWVPYEEELAGKVLLRYTWHPLLPCNDNSSSKDTSSSTDTNETDNLPPTTEPITSTKKDQNDEQKEVEVTCCTTNTPFTASSACSRCGKPIEGCCAHILHGNNTELLLPPSINLSNPLSDTVVSGVLAVMVERSKLHYGKLPRVPTVAVYLNRPTDTVTALGLDPAANPASLSPLPHIMTSQQCRRRHHQGKLQWDQTFYLPIHLTRREVEEGGITLRVDIGDVVGSLLLGGKWRHMRLGSAVFTLDMFDSYHDDVEVVAYTELKLADVVKTGKMKEKKVLLPPPLTEWKDKRGGLDGKAAAARARSARAAEFERARKSNLGSIGNVVLDMAWFPSN